MARYKQINNERIELTAEEEAILNERESLAPTPFDKAIQILREDRNILLSKTDYLALSDNTMSEEMKTYRQELRDITEGLTTEEEVNTVVFPIKPN
tara:strand:+ start:2715 stop:3002 length:288 start_codon:yes stop_codon:yes gene_type:complete